MANKDRKFAAEVPPAQRPRGITKAGSSIARTVLYEAAWNYRTTPKIGQWMKERCPPVAQNIHALALVIRAA